MSNRIADRIARKQAEIAAKLANGTLTAAKLKKAEADLVFDTEEHAKFQTLKSLAVSDGLLTLEEGQMLYRLLGESPTVFARQDAAVKVVLWSLFKELLQAEIRRRGVEV